MPAKVVVGTQWGDEGKAKIVDYLTENSDVVVRFQGGANAGHTVVVGDKKHVFHLLPSGILYDDKICVVGSGVVVELEELFKEINYIKSEGIDIAGRLFVSNRAHVVMPYHKKLDRLRESKLGDGKIGTTCRGIGPAYEDKVSRVGIRIIDIQNEKLFREKVAKSLFEKNILFEKAYGAEPSDSKEVCEEILKYRDELKQYSSDTSLLLGKTLTEGKNVLFEGAQGMFLDIDHGTYPFVTSSNTISGGACAGSGVGPGAIEEVVGVVKAYTTRVGNGPFPSEADEKDGEELRTIGNEIGATTGRPRRCGWFDAVMMRKSATTNGLNSIAITKLDVLSGFEKIKIVVAYKIDGVETSDFPVSLEDLGKVTPVYEYHDGWNCDITGCKTVEDLPANAIKYLKRLEELVNAKVTIISVGPKREQTIDAKSF